MCYEILGGFGLRAIYFERTGFPFPSLPFPFELDGMKMRPSLLGRLPDDLAAFSSLAGNPLMGDLSRSRLLLCICTTGRPRLFFYG